MEKSGSRPDASVNTFATTSLERNIMKIEVVNSCPSTVKADWLVVLLPESSTLGANLAAVDAALGGTIVGLMKREDFSGDANESLVLYQTTGIAATNVCLVGVGDVKSCNVRSVRQAMLAGLRICCTSAGQSVAIAADEAIVAQVTTPTFARTTADAIQSAPIDAGYYKTKRSRHPFAAATLCIADDQASVATALQQGHAIGECCVLVKNMVNRTAEDLNPVTFAADAVALAEASGLECEVLEEADLVREKMGAMLAVARGSELPARMVKLTWNGADSGPKLAIVGKGVTFDSGGYSIKPSDSMISMKADMAGAATALGAIVAAAKLKLPVRLTAYLGLVENMISGNAYRLGDVVTARNGTTIEIHNTDAEGRLVLADCLTYAVDDGAERMIDMATLTGACVVALGEEVTGVFAGDESLSDELVKASKTAGEFFWPMPMHDHFRPLLKSKVADCKNVGPRWGGAVTAAKFLQKFVGDVPWVHLDIAGPSWAESGNSWQDAGGTADPLRSIVAWLESSAAS